MDQILLCGDPDTIFCQSLGIGINVVIPQEMEARIFSLEALVSLLIEELPKARQSDIVTKLLERACRDRGQAEVAKSWDDEIRGWPRTSEGSRIELWHSHRRRDEIFGFQQ